MLSLPDPRAPKEPATPSTRRVPKLSKRCSTAPRGSSDTTRAFGLWRWQHRRASRRGLHAGGSRARLSGAPWRVFSGEMAAGQAVDHLPRPPLRKKKRRRDGLMEVAAANPKTWAVGFLDECWWSRVALPTLSSFSEEGKPLRLIQQSVAKDDSEPKAISCYGLCLPEIGDTWLRFVDGRPISSITTQFLDRKSV